MVIPDAELAVQRLEEAGVRFISSGVVNLPDASLEFRQVFLVRDPGGYAGRIVEQSGGI